MSFRRDSPCPRLEIAKTTPIPDQNMNITAVRLLQIKTDGRTNGFLMPMRYPDSSSKKSYRFFGDARASQVSSTLASGNRIKKKRGCDTFF